MHVQNKLSILKSYAQNSSLRTAGEARILSHSLRRHWIRWLWKGTDIFSLQNLLNRAFFLSKLCNIYNVGYLLILPISRDQNRQTGILKQLILKSFLPKLITRIYQIIKRKLLKISSGSLLASPRQVCVYIRVRYLDS